MHNDSVEQRNDAGNAVAVDAAGGAYACSLAEGSI
jgi:hypothetical protein